MWSSVSILCLKSSKIDTNWHKSLSSPTQSPTRKHFLVSNERYVQNDIFYSSAMALILLWLKDISHFVILQLYIRRLWFSLCDLCHLSVYMSVCLMFFLLTLAVYQLSQLSVVLGGTSNHYEYRWWILFWVCYLMFWKTTDKQIYWNLISFKG